MRVTINGSLVVDDQEKLFQEVRESFIRHIEEYRRKHWFKELIYEFTDGEDLVDMDRIKVKLWFWKLVITLKLLRVLLVLSPPGKEQAEEMLVALEKSRNKLEV